ncbi:hypothetical protein B0H10DRAFT_1967482 [Mycena sp. CBHHK59/15]|nr:hypothetical protein B0H10DRAFT_1967482 [Mycena sp. CBHHK59/15]
MYKIPNGILLSNYIEHFNYFRLRLISPGIETEKIDLHFTSPGPPNPLPRNLTGRPKMAHWNPMVCRSGGIQWAAIRRLRRSVAARASPHLRRGHLHPRCAAGGGSSGRRDVAPVEMLDAAAPPEAREAGMPLEAHKAITPPADVLGAREPGEDPSKSTTSS